MTEDIRLNDRRPSEETHLIRLSVEDQSVVVDAILGPPAPNDALCRAAAAAYRALVATARRDTKKLSDSYQLKATD